MKNHNATGKSRNRMRISLKILAIFFVFYAVAGFIVIPVGLKHYLPGILSGAIKRPVTISYVRLNPFSLSITIGEVKIPGEKGDEFVSIGRIYGNLQLSSIWRGGPVVKLVEVRKPSIHIIKNRDGAFNFSDILESKSGEASSPPASGATDKGPKVVFDLGRLSVRDADIHYRDNALSFQTDLTPLDISLTHVTNVPGQIAEFDISGKTPFNESVQITGSLRLTPLLIKGRIETSHIDLSRYAPFYAGAAGVVITKGTADVRTSFIFPEDKAQNGNGELVYDATVTLASLALADSNQKDKNILTLPELTVSGLSLSLVRKCLHVCNITTTGAVVHVERFADGGLNIASHSGVEEKSVDKTGEAVVPEGAGDAASPGWTIDVDKLSVGRYALQLTDNIPVEPVFLDVKSIDINGISFSNRPGSSGDVALSFKTGKGIFAARGKVSLAPLSVDLDLKAEDIGIVPVCPYIKEKTGINITNGHVNASGHVTVLSGPQGLSGDFIGGVALSDFSAADGSVKDGSAGDAFVQWTKLAFSGVRVSLQPLSITMGNILLLEPNLKIIRLSGGALNLMNIVHPPGPQDTTQAKPIPTKTEQEGQAEEPASQSIPIEIKSVDVNKGIVVFADREIDPAFECTLSDMNLHLNKLLFPGAHQSDFTFSGKFEDQAGLSVSGALFPLDLNHDTRVDFDFSNVELPVFTPYFSHYLGYELKKGKLFLKLGYTVQQNRMRGENHVLFDKLYLGNSVKSPAAVSLPLSLALALLRDRNEQINMDVPVQGDVENPEFRYGRVIYNAFINLISKIATSPFAALGSMFQDADQLGFVSFSPGSDVLVESQVEKIRKLLDALYERPLLQLVIDPTADPVGDGQALVDRAFMQSIGGERVKKSIIKNNSAPIDESLDLREKLTEKEYRACLVSACKKAGIQVSGVSEKELEQRLKSLIVISDQALLKLAHKRGVAVRDAIYKENRINPARVFLTTARTGSSSMVAFNLKAE